MCVTVAIKLPRDRETGKPTKDSQWTLFKIRDRAYDPVYQFKTLQTDKSTTLFLVDEDSDWTECIRVNNASGDTELMFVNSALNNSMDKKDGTSKSKTVKKNGKKADHGLTARRASREMNLKEALKSFQEMKFDGCTFVSDGDKCFLIESSLPADVKKELKAKKTKEGAENTLRSAAKEEDYVSTVEEVTDWLCVRTNHGVTNEEAGYQENDGISFESSTSRREKAEEYIKGHVFEVSDILPAVDAMGEEFIEKNAFLRPRRVKEEVEKIAEKDPDFKSIIYSTSAFVMTSNGSIRIKLYDASISEINMGKIYNQDFPINVSIER